MKQISNIASHQINFKSQTKTQTSPIEAVKTKIENMEDSEKITVGLSALGVLALAALAIARRPHKAAEIAQDIVEEKPVQQAIGHVSKAQKQKEAIAQGVERAIKATEEYVQGGNYSEVRSNATKNLSHDGKKVVQGALSNAHSAKVAQDISSKNQLVNMVNDASNNAASAKNARQGMKNATKEQLIEKLNEAYEGAYQAQTAANQAKITAQEIGTKKAHKAAFRAEKAAQRAEIEADTTRYRAHQRNIELAQQKAQKEANIAQQMASPNYAVGQEKLELHAQQTTANKAKRDVSKLKKMPKYQKTIQDFQRKRYSGDKLLKIMDNPSSSEIEKLAAQELLENITK